MRDWEISEQDAAVRGLNSPQLRAHANAADVEQDDPAVKPFPTRPNERDIAGRRMILDWPIAERHQQPVGKGLGPAMGRDEAPLLARAGVATAEFMERIDAGLFAHPIETEQPAIDLAAPGEALACRNGEIISKSNAKCAPRRASIEPSKRDQSLCRSHRPTGESPTIVLKDG